jgi:hypothetical protein
MSVRITFLLAAGLIWVLVVLTWVATAGTARPPDAAAIKRLVAQLGSPKFQERAAADKQLEAIGEPALEILRDAAQHSGDNEIRRRAARLVQAIERRLYGEVRRFLGHQAGIIQIACSLTAAASFP